MILQSIELTTRAGIAATSNSTLSGAAAQNGTINSDFNTFLTLLTTQLRNQDPLKPMDSTEFVGQLASFSAVEQQVRTNEKLSEIANLLIEKASSTYSKRIGDVVLAPVAASWSGNPIAISWATFPNADSYWLQVLNSSGAVVDVSKISDNKSPTNWSGLLSDGTIAAAGDYHFAVESRRGTDQLDLQKGLVQAKVESLQFVGGVPSFVLADGTVLPASDFG